MAILYVPHETTITSTTMKTLHSPVSQIARNGFLTHNEVQQQWTGPDLQN